ncbi:hypothetical protein [Actinokineospora sp.]|uniref:hypothetical protein n=1 Tax=Actinokineospora sp. TaxID=1872133 RepID=UPI004037B336
MPVRMTRLLLGVLLAALVTLGAAPLAAAVAQPPATDAPLTDAPAGPRLDPPTEADAAKSKDKLIIGVTALVLLGVVVYGNRVRAKRRKTTPS